MRVLIIHRYFWPDTPPYAHMLRHMAAALSEDGHDVMVLTSQPSYSESSRRMKCPRMERLDGFAVRRVWLLPERKQNFVVRTINLMLFISRVLFYIVFNRRFDAVMAATTPPVMVAWAACLAARLKGASFIYHCQDIHPEIIEKTGVMKPGVFTRLLRKLDYQTTRRASRIVVLSRDMAETLRRRGPLEANKIQIINNFVTDMPEQLEAGQEAGNAQNLKIGFAGNLGYFQGLEAVIDAAALPGAEGATIIFLGDGAALESLKQHAGSKSNARVEFLARLPKREADEFIRKCDLCLIALAPGIIEVAYPSKTMAYLAQGKPVIAMVESKSELGELIIKGRIGFLCEPGDSNGLAEIVREIVSDKGQLSSMGERASSLAERQFSRASKMRQWQELYRGLLNTSASNV